MDNEKTLLTNELGKLESEGNAENLESFAADTELMGGHEELVERAKKFAAELKAKASQVGAPTPGEEKEITDLGGSTTEVAAQVEASVTEAATVATGAEQAIEAKVADAAPEMVSAENPEYVGKSFGPDTGKIQYEITGEAKITDALDGTGQNVLTFPCKVYEKIGENQEPQMVEQQGFYDPRTKEAYWKSDVKGHVYFTCPDEIKASLEKTYAELNTGAVIEARVADAAPENVPVTKEREVVKAEDITVGSIFDFKSSNGQTIEVKVETEVQKTNDVHPREYVRVKATQGSLETDVLVSDLIPKAKTVEETPAAISFQNISEDVIKNLPESRENNLIKKLYEEQKQINPDAVTDYLANQDIFEDVLAFNKRLKELEKIKSKPGADKSAEDEYNNLAFDPKRIDLDTVCFNKNRIGDKLIELGVLSKDQLVHYQATWAEQLAKTDSETDPSLKYEDSLVYWKSKFS